MSELSQTEQATATLKAHQAAERSLAEKYTRVFGTKDGQDVLADLLNIYPCDRARFDAVSTRANPVAALMGGIHFDGSAAVTKYILDRIEESKAKLDNPPTISGS